MKRYLIYKEIKKFYITNNVIVFSILGFYLLYAGIRVTFFKEANTTIFDKAIMGLLFITMVTGFIVKVFLSWSLYKPLKGKIEGFLELQENEIIVEDIRYSIDEIKEIEIWNFDFKGEIDSYIDRTNFNGIKSNGVENLFKITFVNGNIIEVHFQQDYGNQMIESKKELTNYYIKGILSFANLARVFGCKDEYDIELFKRTLPTIENLEVI